MIEKEMEDLIAQHTEEFFPRKVLVLRGRQETFSSVGRFDLLFEDQFGSKILMELKARPAKYEDATQLAKYKEALDQRGQKNIIMWLVAPIIPKPVRDFMDTIGIQYSEIHEAEFRQVAANHDYVFASEARATSLEVGRGETRIEKVSGVSPRASSWGKPANRVSDSNEFLSRCDEAGKVFYARLFEALTLLSNKVRITWDHESGFSLQFRFPRLGFVEMLWGFPAVNRDGKPRMQSLMFPFDFAAKRNVPEHFIQSFGHAVADRVSITGGSKRLTIRVKDLSPEEARHIVSKIVEFADRATQGQTNES